MSLPVIIIGAGVSGLTLAQGLARHNLTFELYERDAALETRPQGYRFRISDAGIAAFRDILPPEKYEKLKRAGCGWMPQDSKSNIPRVVLDAVTAGPGKPLGPPPPQGAGNAPPPAPETQQPWTVDRSVLRKIMLSGIEDRVQFGKPFSSYDTTADGILVRFKDGTERRGCLLVGADGSWSPVRQQLLPNYRLVDTEARITFGKTPLTDDFSARFNKEMLGGMSTMRDSATGLVCLEEPMRFDRTDPDALDDYVYWAVFTRKPDDAAEDERVLAQSGAENLARIRRLTSHWHGAHRPLFEENARTQASILRIVSARPPIPAWPGSERVTLMGDAAHAMAPTAVLGATTALADASRLSQALATHGLHASGIEAARAEYEGAMREYATAALNKSVINGRMAFGMKDFDQLPEIELRKVAG